MYLFVPFVPTKLWIFSIDLQTLNILPSTGDMLQSNVFKVGGMCFTG